MDDNFNSIDDLLCFFDLPDRPVTVSEFVAFWNSLTLDEKAYYNSISLT